MMPRCAFAIGVLLTVATVPAAAGECPLENSVLEPIEAPGTFVMSVAREEHGYRFALTQVALRRTVRFLGSHQNGTGHLVLDEDQQGGAEADAAKPKPITSRVLLLRANLRTVDPWNRNPTPIAYALFEGLALQLWDRARFRAEDDTPGSAPPEGPWRVLRCRSR